MRNYGPRLLGRQRRRYKPEVAPTGLGSQPAFCASRVGQDVPRLGKYGHYAVTVTILYPLLVSFSIMRAPHDRKTHIPKALVGLASCTCQYVLNAANVRRNWTCR